jgi:hypothetical protein
MAGYLSAAALADASLSAAERTQLIKRLVHTATRNPTTLDTVLSRLLLAARPDNRDLIAMSQSLTVE